MSTSGCTVPAGTGGVGTRGVPPPPAVPPQAAPAEPVVPAAAAPATERPGTLAHVSASTTMPVGSWVCVLSCDSGCATLGLCYGEGLAVVQAQVVHQISYPLQAQVVHLVQTVVPTVPQRGGGRGPLGAAAPGQGSAACFGGGPAELASDTGNSETAVFPVVPMWL